MAIWWVGGLLGRKPFAVQATTAVSASEDLPAAAADRCNAAEATTAGSGWKNRPEAAEVEQSPTCDMDGNDLVKIPRVTIARGPLFDAVARRNVAEVELLLTSGAYDDTFDACVEEWGDYIYVAPLWVAVVNGDVRSVALLLEKKADLNRTVQKCGHITRHYYGSCIRTPLAHAGAAGDADLVKLLMKHGADPDIECIEEDFNGFAIDQPPDSRIYRAKDCCKVGMSYLSAIIDDYSQQRVAALQDYIMPGLEDGDEDDDDDGGVFLTHRLAKQLLEELIKLGKQMSARDELLLQWGFGSPREAEAALRVAIDNDRTGKLQEMKDLWLVRMMKGT